MKFLTIRNLCVAILLAAVAGAEGQGAAFTYQGRLTGSNGPANGLYDFIFLVYDSPSNAVPLVSGYPISGVPVSNGLFTSRIDFGAGVFTGAPRWLGINVRTNGAIAYTELLPRQEMTSTPYAVTAAQVSSGGIAAGSYSNAVVFGNSGNSFSGTFGGNGAALSNVTAATLGGLGTNSFWQTRGNGGTVPTVNFLGTTDNQPLELRANNQRALRLEPSPGGDAPNLIAGHGSNFVAAGVVGATISGGGYAAGGANLILSGSAYGTIGGGSGNRSGSYSTVGGGGFNSATGAQATVSGGNINVAGGFLTTVGGGRQNWASGDLAAIGGGYNNVASGPDSFIGGGRSNTVNGASALIGGGTLNTIQLNANHATIAGGLLNTIQSTAYQATVGGGTSNVVAVAAALSAIGGGSNNVASGPGAAIAGGINNNAGDSATVGGGIRNAAGRSSTVAGGFFNFADQVSVVSGGGSNSAYGAYNTIAGGFANAIDYAIAGSTIGGGQNNVISWRFADLDGFWATISGGIGNLAIGEASTVPGGSNNVANSAFSFAAGRNARASHVGAFVWADSQDTVFSSTGTNQFAVRAANGVVIQAAADSTALEVRTGGAIKVTGAGVGTPTPVFIHRAAAGANISGHITTIDHPMCNGDPNAILIVTPNYNPGGAGGTYNNHPIGVYYNGSRWTIFNQDFGAMPDLAAFNVMVFKR